MRAEKARSRLPTQKMGMLAMGVAHLLVASFSFAASSQNFLGIAFNVGAAVRANDCMETSQQEREAFPAPVNFCGKAFGRCDSSVNRDYYITLLWTVSLNHVMIVNNKIASFMKEKAFHKSQSKERDHVLTQFM